MASINKKTASNKYERVGDTQGLIVPQAARYCKAQVRAGQVISNNAQSYEVKYDFIEGENWLTTDSRFTAPVDGIYSFNPAQFITVEPVTAGTVRKTIIKLVGINNVVTILNFHPLNNYNGAANYFVPVPVTVKMAKGESIYLGAWINSGPATLTVKNSDPTGTGFLTFALIEQAVPDIIANRGALVSSDDLGKVKIGDNGTMQVNDYYSTNEVKTNKVWIDGKPIYRKVLNNVVIGDINGLAAGASKVFPFSSIISEFSRIVNECLFLAISGLTDANRLGTNTTHTSATILSDTYITAFDVNKNIAIKNTGSAAVDSNNRNVILHGWVEYTKL